jgi:hypothetical protein
MYSKGQILKGVRDPRFAALQFNRRFADDILTKIRPKTNFFEEDWDNLLILDSCRYDLLKSVSDGADSLEYRWSPGSNSEEFIQYHTAGGPLNDVVWVTANPFVSRHRSEIFKVIDVWDTGWDDELQTVLPKTVKQAAVAAEKEYPNKRLVVQFMQPHYPFIDEFSQTELPAHSTFDTEFDEDGEIQNKTEGRDIWEYLRANDVSKHDLWTGYRENLQTVLPIAQQLGDQLTGRTVITSDHGNELGGYSFPVPIRLYGHPRGLRSKNLVKVPWLISDSPKRKEITGEDMSVDSEHVDGSITDRLRALGYQE